MNTKECKACLEIKDVQLFYKSRKLYYSTACKACICKNKRVAQKALQTHEVLSEEKETGLRTALLNRKNKLTDICKAEGISYYTLKRWMDREGS